MVVVHHVVLAMERVMVHAEKVAVEVYVMAHVPAMWQHVQVHVLLTVALRVEIARCSVPVSAVAASQHVRDHVPMCVMDAQAIAHLVVLIRAEAIARVVRDVQVRVRAHVLEHVVIHVHQHVVDVVKHVHLYAQDALSFARMHVRAVVMDVIIRVLDSVVGPVARAA